MRATATPFPVPVMGDGENHVYVSVGHQQMMTDAMKPLGLSVWQLTTPRPMVEAGGRLFVDVTANLAAPAEREGLLALLGRSDPLIADSLQTVLDRGDFIPSPPEGGSAAPPAGGPGPLQAYLAAPDPMESDPAIVTELIEHTQVSITTLRRDIRTASGSTLFDFILEDIQELRRILFDPRSHQVIMTAMEATTWLDERMEAWLGEKSAADALTQSVANNVTSEMGLALLDVADAIRPHLAVVEYLRHAQGDDVLEGLGELEGGREASKAIRAYLGAYGMRCVGEIDITRPRWSERPSMLVPVIVGHIDNFQAGERRRRFEQGRRKARAQEQELLERVRGLPHGEQKASETKRMIDRVRAFIGYREYPKYGMVSRYCIYKQALLTEAERLARAGVLGDRDDIYYLRFDELHDVVRTNRVDDQLIRERKAAFQSYEDLTPPRVLTSDGEAVAGEYRRDGQPTGALVGLPVSAGTVEGRARVIVDIVDADLDEGDILVTTHTDPSWSPVFVTIGGLITEVGGLMTHGAVVAREYGLPAVVGVDRATRLIRDGQRIRLNGTDGSIETLADR